MTFPVVRQSLQSSFAFERLMQQLGVSHGDNFTAARQLVALVEANAPNMSVVDRLQLARIMSATAHSITLSCGDERI
jgi:hypothetical protein